MSERGRPWYLGAALIVAVAVTAVLPTHGHVIVGGHARPLGVPAEPGPPRTGQFLLPTAAVRPLTLVESLLGRHGDLALSGTLGTMAESKRLAWKAALAVTGTPLLVRSVTAGSPAADAGLAPGDAIVEVDQGRPSSERLDRLLALNHPVSVRVLRAGQVADLEIRPHAPWPQPAGGGSVLEPGTPPAPLLDTGSAQGDSGGLLLALATVDLLTTGDLTHGRRIAATGFVGDDGGIGRVEAYRVKTKAAARAGASLVLVPDDDEAHVREVAPANVEVVGVHTVTQAVWELCQRGGTSSVCRRSR